MSTTPNTPANAGKAIPQWIEYACRDAVTAIVDNATSHHTWSQADALPIMMELATKLIERDRAERDAELNECRKELEKQISIRSHNAVTTSRQMRKEHEGHVASVNRLMQKLAEREAELKNLISDSAEDHTFLEDCCRKAGVDAAKIAGDSYGVPDTQNLASFLMAKLAEKSAALASAKEALNLAMEMGPGCSTGFIGSVQAKARDALAQIEALAGGTPLSKITFSSGGKDGAK